MVTRKKSKQMDKTGRVKVGQLPLNKETVKDLTPLEKKQIGGGFTAGITQPIIKDVASQLCPTHGCPSAFACPTFLICPTP